MITDNLDKINASITKAAKEAGRKRDEITLIAVSKRKPASLILEAMSAGQVDFGENYLQEAQEKISTISGPARWHFIGGLQSNKAKAAVTHFNLIHTVDRFKLAKALNKFATQQDKIQEILVQVNVGRELQKGGVLPEKSEELLNKIGSLDHLSIRGLMTMPPATQSKEEARPYFAMLRELGEKYQHSGLISKDAPLILSMGMSNDFEAAIAEGATMVRVGTAIFGTRE